MQIRADYIEKCLPKDIELFLVTTKGNNKYQLKRAKITEFSNNLASLTFSLRKFCRQNNIDLLVNLGNPQESFIMLLSTLFTKTNYMVNIVSNIIERARVQENFSEKFILSVQNFFLPISFYFSKKIILPSKDITKKTKRRLFFMKNRVIHSPLILDDIQFSPMNKNKARRMLNLPLKKKIILSVGRIQYLKGSDILFELIKNNPDKLFILIGHLMDNKFINSKLKNLKVLNSINSKQLTKYYNSADLYISASRLEAYNLSFREAMLCGIPCIVSDIDSSRTTRSTLKVGLNAEEMQKQIIRFFAMPEKQRAMIGRNSRDEIIKECSFNLLKDKHKDLLLN
jgi:glycosyltransferase involved in cell wall biosynthesis